MTGLSMRITTMIVAGAVAGLGATAAVAQSPYDSRYDSRYSGAYQGPSSYDSQYGYDARYGYQTRSRSESRSYGSDWSVAAQRDRPGDYRCDAYWDANRTDCDARWRDQRDVRRKAPHFGQETDQSDDRLELAQFEDAAARDKHLRVLAVLRHRVHDPRAIPTVMALLGSLVADHLDEVAI